MILFNTKKATFLILYKLLKELKIKVSYETIENKLRKHPSFPNIKSISDILLSFNVKNKVTAIELNIIPKLETPFLALTNTEETILVKKTDKKKSSIFLHQKVG